MARAFLSRTNKDDQVVFANPTSKFHVVLATQPHGASKLQLVTLSQQS